LYPFDQAASLYDLDLFLYDVSDSLNWLMLANSASLIDNSENLWMVLNGGDYALQVKAGITQADFEWDYALAWRATATVPVPPAFWLLGSALGLLGWMRRIARR
jgi:hypothetical protein